MDQSKSLSSEDDLFVIEAGKDAYLVYAPLRGVIFEANGAAVNAITALVRGVSAKGKNVEVEDFARERGLLTAPAHIPIIPHEKIPATRLTLSLTERCNLRCIYCYASAGKGKTIPWHIAATAIETVAKNAAEAGRSSLHLSFHGTGEATFDWDLLRYSIAYAEDQARKRALTPDISMVTNATLISEERAKYLASHLRRATVSFDGLEEAHNSQRPFPDGKGSFKAVLHGAVALRKAGLPISIRSTITANNVDQMAEMVEFFVEVLGPHARVQFEPVESCGRARTDPCLRLDQDQFLAEYKRAVLCAERLGARLSFSGDNHNRLRRVFCGANGRIFCVLPGGEVTGCTRVTSPDHPLSEKFFYGKYVPDEGFVLDVEKLESLRATSLDSVPPCANCFCKWHCAAQCPHTRFSDDGHFSFMCHLTREITKWRLLRKLEGEG